MYKLTDNNSVIRLTDGACIPLAEGNRDYQAYLKWIEEGNTAEGEVENTSSQRDLANKYVITVQEYLDTTVQERNYDSILSLCSYATSTVEKFQREGQAGVLWRDAVWARCYKILAEVQAGTRDIPTDIIAELPVMEWGETL